MDKHGNQVAAKARRLLAELHDELVGMGRPPDSVTLVAISKTFGIDTIIAAAQSGLMDFGENRVQEAKNKIPEVLRTCQCRWHLVGHLQTNKAKDAVTLFDLIQSVDSFELAQALDHRAGLIGKRQEVLIQVNTTAEPQKSGCDPAALDDLVEGIVRLAHLRLVGLMTIGPFVDDPGPITSAFRLLRREFDRLASHDLRGGAMHHCSMGMTDDWRIALAEGSTMLRIGRAIFGERSM